MSRAILNTANKYFAYPKLLLIFQSNIGLPPPTRSAAILQGKRECSPNRV